jgi:copper transport protein
MILPAASRGSRRLKRRSPRLIAVVVLGCLPLIAAQPVGAHAQVVSIDPADGAHLGTAPPSVTVVFNEPVALAPGGLAIVDGAGRSVDEGPEIVDGATVVQPLDDLADGWYVVTWAIISEDGHPLHSSSVFAVGAADEAARPPGPGPIDPIALVGDALRAITDLALLVAAGAMAAWWLLGARRPRVERLGVWSIVVSIAASLGWVAVGYLEGGAVWLSTTYAIAAYARIGLLGLALLAGRRFPDIGAALVPVALITLAVGGHATGDVIATALQSVHLLAAVVWLGAAPAVLLVMRDPGVGDEQALGVVRSFSRLAGVALVTVGVAGFLLSAILTDRFAGGFTTPWVLILGAKVGVVGVAALLGGLGRRALARDAQRRRYRWLFAVDASLLVGVAALSAMLTTTAPQQEHGGHGRETPLARCTTTVGDASVALVATPGRVGSNELVVSGVPQGVREVRLELEHTLTGGGSLQVQLEEDEQGRWNGAGALPFEGRWNATVVVRVDTFAEERGGCVIGITP